MLEEFAKSHARGSLAPAKIFPSAIVFSIAFTFSITTAFAEVPDAKKTINAESDTGNQTHLATDLASHRPNQGTQNNSQAKATSSSELESTDKIDQQNSQSNQNLGTNLKQDCKLLSAEIETKIEAPISFVWDTLTQFEEYPKIFTRISKVRVQKIEGSLVWTESILKKQLFVNVPRQLILNDLSKRPYKLKWKLLEGNFKSAQGLWELKSIDSGKACLVKYTLGSSSGPIPESIFGLTLKLVQKDIVKSFKKKTEELYKLESAKLDRFEQTKISKAIQ